MLTSFVPCVARVVWLIPMISVVPHLVTEYGANLFLSRGMVGSNHHQFSDGFRNSTPSLCTNTLLMVPQINDPMISKLLTLNSSLHHLEKLSDLFFQGLIQLHATFQVLGVPRASTCTLDVTIENSLQVGPPLDASFREVLETSSSQLCQVNENVVDDQHVVTCSFHMTSEAIILEPDGWVDGPIIFGIIGQSKNVTPQVLPWLEHTWAPRTVIICGRDLRNYIRTLELMC